MPELPEVETVRRGLQPAMEGAKIVHAEARRKDLRFPFQKDFVARLEGQTVTGLGRRAKYLLADLASGDVLLMHLGMSGSIRIARSVEFAGRALAIPRDHALVQQRRLQAGLPVGAGARQHRGVEFITERLGAEAF